MDAVTKDQIFQLGVQLLSLEGKAQNGERDKLFKEIALLMAKNGLTFLAIPDHGCDIHRDLTIKCGPVDCMKPDDLTPVLQGMRVHMMEF